MPKLDKKQLVAKLRRLVLVHLKPGYVKKQQTLRNGKCNQCGKCCALFIKCPMLKDDGLCTVYGKYRPKVCKVYPVDHRDIEEIKTLGGSCGYNFQKPACKQ